MERLKGIAGHLKGYANPKCDFTFPKKLDSLKDKVMVVTGGSRGIGLAIAKRAAQDGAKVAILAKTVKENPKIPGTIYTAAKEIEAAGGQALPIPCDIRDEESVKNAINKVVETWGRIDILVNNASAINPTRTTDLPMKSYDLMMTINARGTFMCSKYCIPHLQKSPNAHILNLAPPLNMDKKWFANHVAYTMSKYGMSMCVLGMSEELRDDGIAVNALWPKTYVATAAVQNILGGDESIKRSRKDTIVSDAAIIVLKSDSRKVTGNFYVDEDILRANGVTDFSKYRMRPDVKEEDLYPDGFLELE
mmetsp:Transcript_35719/g.41656  ORF Transcript_35719/g.41656 Transcript_35719/m.41656 type:complete len:306 (-) Transcript_35719:111-1028(-)